jgi:hypothetical protein
MHLPALEYLIVFAALLVCPIPAVMLATRLPEYCGIFHVGARGSVVAAASFDGGMAFRASVAIGQA